MAAVGVHVGNSYACLALCTSGTPSVVANDSGDRVTPAVVALNGSEWEIGLPAKLGQIRNRPVITKNKRLQNDNLKEDDIPLDSNNTACKIVFGGEGVVKYELNADEKIVRVTPDDIATKIFGKLYTIASHNARTDGDLNVVLAVPLHWSSASRQRLTTSAELAGFNVVQIISEPAAAALAYQVGEEDPELETYVLVYRLGGTTCDATILKVSNGMLSVEKTVHRPDLGGNCLTADLTEYVAQEFRQKWKIDPRESRRSMMKIFNHADDCKHVLSTLSSAQLFIESLIDGVDWSQNVTRARFENIISSKIPALMEPVHTVLKESGLADKIKKIIVCGGCMKTPKLQSAISDVLPEAEVLMGIASDEVIAEGCSRQAYLHADLPELNLTNIEADLKVTTKSIYAKYQDQVVCLFKEGTPLPGQNSFSIEELKVPDSLELCIYGEDNVTLDTVTIPSPVLPLTVRATLQETGIAIAVV